MKTRILYIEDEPFLGKIVKETLENQGFEVVWETDGAKVLGRFNNYSPDICLLDIMLPNIDGYTLCEQIRKMYPSLPIIFLTAKVETSDLVRGFEAGGNDYVKKPFSVEEVIARIKNQMRITEGQAGKESQKKIPEEIKLGKYSLLTNRYELIAPSGKITLSHRDKQVLQILAANRNRITDRKNLLLAVWGDDSFFNSRNLDVYIRKIRDYLKEDPSIELKTLKGKGYLFMVPETNV